MESLMSSMVSTSVDTTYSFFDAEALIIDTRRERTVTVFCVNKTNVINLNEYLKFLDGGRLKTYVLLVSLTKTASHNEWLRKKK